MSDSTRFLVCYLACLKVPKTIEKPFVSIFLGFEGFFSYIDPSKNTKMFYGECTFDWKAYGRFFAKK